MRDKLNGMESEGRDDPTISFLGLCTHLTRSEAARLFYQVLGEWQTSMMLLDSSD